MKIDYDIELIIDSYRNNTNSEAMKQLKSKMEAFEDLKRYKLKNEKLTNKLEKTMNEINMIKAENTLKGDNASTDKSVLKLEISNLKSEMKEKEKQYKEELKSIRLDKKKEIDKYVKNSSEIVEKNTTESSK